MVKVTKPGVLPGKEKYYATCPNCKCEFEFLAEEARLMSDQREGDYYEIDCPTGGCFRKVTISRYGHGTPLGLRK